MDIVNFNPNGEIDQNLLNFVDNLTINSIRVSYTVNNWNFNRQLKLILLLDPGFREGMFDKNESGSGLLPFYFINNNKPNIDEYKETDYGSFGITNKKHKYLLRRRFFIDKSPAPSNESGNNILFKENLFATKKADPIQTIFNGLKETKYDIINKQLKLVIYSMGHLTGNEGKLSESIIIKEISIYNLSQNLKSGTETEFIKFAESVCLQFSISDIIELLEQL